MAEYIQLLDKRFIQKYLKYTDTAYWNYDLDNTITQPEFICSKFTIETLEESVKYVQS